MLDLFVGQLGQIARKLGDTTAAPLAQDAIAFGRRTDPDHASIARVALAFYEAITLHAHDQACHCGCAHLLGAGELTDRLGAAEYNDRECRQPRRRDAGRIILLAQAAQ